jgi:predicted nucleic acid-binding protein
MIVIDTNVISELMRPEPDPPVLEWSRHVAATLPVTTTVSEAELRFGVLRLPSGRRRDALQAVLEQLLGGLLAGRILPFDRQAATEYASFAAARQAVGRPVPTNDAMIAAIARAHGATAIATRNLRDFEGSGVALVDPWAG